MMASSALRSALRSHYGFMGLVPINKVNEVRIHIRFNISTVTKNVINMANSENPDQMQCFAESHLGLHYLHMFSFLDFFS